MSISAITASAKGSWKWQDAFRLSDYTPYVTKDGRVLLRSVCRSAKYSWPQLRRNGFTSTLPRGSLHNKRPQITVVDDFGNLIGAWHSTQFAAA